MDNTKKSYSEGLTRFVNTIAKETAEDKTDGILGKLLQITGSVREVYEFITGEGFDITYAEFLEYYKVCENGVSLVNTELSDEELDTVAGGWGFHSIKKIAKKAAKNVANTAYDSTKYVADNPGAFIAGSGAIGGGIGTAAGAAVGAVTGGVIGMGTIIIANELTD